MPNFNARVHRSLSRWSLVGFAVLATGAMLGACGQGKRTPPTPGANQEQLRQRLNEQAAQSRAREEQQKQARRTAALEQSARQRGWSEGHNATVACLQGERAQTDGNELRCEEQAYVEQNYREAKDR